MKTNNDPMNTSTGNHSHGILVLGNPETACGLIAMALNHREDVVFTDNAVEAFNLLEQKSFGVVIAFQKDEIGIGMNFMDLSVISQINEKVVNRVITTNLSPDSAREIIEKSEIEFIAARENGAWIHDLRRQNHQYEFMLRQKLAC